MDAMERDASGTEATRQESSSPLTHARSLLSERQLAALAALLDGTKTLSAVAEAVGVHRDTLLAWRQPGHPFAQALALSREVLADEAMARVKGPLMDAASAVLAQGTLGNLKRPKQQLRAAEAIARIAGHWERGGPTVNVTTAIQQQAEGVIVLDGGGGLSVHSVPAEPSSNAPDNGHQKQADNA